MHKSWSISYSHSNNGSQTSDIIHNYHNDGVHIYEDGYSRIQDKDLHEKFYKIKRNKNGQSKKIFLGKSKNKKEWELYGNNNGNKQLKKKKYHNIKDHFIKNDSKKHRLEDVINPDKIDHIIRIPNKPSIDNSLSSMLERMNIEMNDFFEDDFFTK